MTDAYQQFLARKRIADPMTGLAHVDCLPAIMKPHQRLPFEEPCMTVQEALDL